MLDGLGTNQDLFVPGLFTFHSGSNSSWKIECDHLSDMELDLFARIIVQKISFNFVVGVPRGGTRLADKLRPYCRKGIDRLLIVDDVLTTGQSMSEAREKVEEIFSDIEILGVVLFARGPCLDWVVPVFQLEKKFWNQ